MIRIEIGCQPCSGLEETKSILGSDVNVYITKITSQCNFSQLNYKNKLAACVNIGVVLEFVSFPTNPLDLSR